jgi:hypothetical protein
MADVELNWSTAAVKKGRLTVELEGEVPSGWKHSFETTAAMLPGGDWGEIEVKKHAVRVSEVTRGSEEKLRHHLESIVEQANAAARASEPQPDSKEAAHPDSPDEQMTESFRAFAR